MNEMLVPGSLLRCGRDDKKWNAMGSDRSLESARVAHSVLL
jgi:hypothetical protein